MMYVMSSEILTWCFAACAGLLLGVIFFGGSWWTVRNEITAKQPGLWFLGNMILRITFVMAGLYLIGGKQWDRLLSCLIGFIAARWIVIWYTQTIAGRHSCRQDRLRIGLQSRSNQTFATGMCQRDGDVRQVQRLLRSGDSAFQRDAFGGACDADAIAFVFPFRTRVQQRTAIHQSNSGWRTVERTGFLRRRSYEGGSVSRAITPITRQIELVANTDSTVLILGENGTGKEVVAREIHRVSGRASLPLTKINCAAIPLGIYESECFGHSKGSFTGALRDRIGHFELADGGTLLLEEIGEIPLEMQTKLLRVLQEGELERIGEGRTRKINVRIIATTNRDLRAEAAAGRFCQDLYYRLSVFPLELPPLRKRLEDIPLLAEHFLVRFASQLGQSRFKLTIANVQDLQRYSWPGNIRELQQVIERACFTSERGRLKFDHLLEAPPASPPENAPQAEERILTVAELRDLEVRNIQTALRRTCGKIYGNDGAATLLCMKPSTLVSRIRTLGIVARG